MIIWSKILSLESFVLLIWFQTVDLALDLLIHWFYFWPADLPFHQNSIELCDYLILNKVKFKLCSASALLSKPQPNLNTTVGFYTEMILQPPPPTQTQRLQYLSCYWRDFDKTLKVGFWEHLEQIPTVTVKFVQAIFVRATFVLMTFVHIRNISAVNDTIWTKL